MYYLALLVFSYSSYCLELSNCNGCRRTDLLLKSFTLADVEVALVLITLCVTDGKAVTTASHL